MVTSGATHVATEPRNADLFDDVAAGAATMATQIMARTDGTTLPDGAHDLAELRSSISRGTGRGAGAGRAGCGWLCTTASPAATDPCRRCRCSTGVLAHCRGLLASFKVPTIVAFRDGPTHTSIGKITKGELRDD